MTKDDDASHGLLGLLSRALSKSVDELRYDQTVERETTSGQTDFEETAAPATIESADRPATAQDGHFPKELTPQPFPNLRRKLSAENVQFLLLRGLRQIPNFPERGVAITVYGFSPWNAMLNFAPRCTSHSNATAFRKALADIVDELRTQVEIEIDQGD